MTAGACVTSLAQLTRLQRRIVLVTVNFDQVLEHDAGDLVRPFITKSEFGKLGGYLKKYAKDGGPVPYIKLHGDVGNVDSIVATIDETEAGLAPERVQAIRTLRRFRPKAPDIHAWIYVGYSMRDVDLNEVFGSSEFATDLVEYWVNPLSDPAISDFIKARRETTWSRKYAQYTVDERTITRPAKSFLGQLHAGLSSP